jgi:hypothetical protein
MKTRFLTGMLLLAAFSAAQAQYNYITNNGTITITGYTGAGGSVTIPSTINGLAVTDIGTNAFQGVPNLTGVTIPNSVTNIQDGAFYGTSVFVVTLGNGLVSIGANAFAFTSYNSSTFLPLTFPNSLTSIGDTAFQACQNINGVKIPSSVTNIGANPFAGCLLASLAVATNNPAYTNVSNVLFNKNQTALIGFPQGGGGTYVVPGTVTNIGACAFYNCDSLFNIIISNTVTSIGSNAFKYCAGLTSCIIPSSVTNIGHGPFSACTSLQAISVDTNNPAYVSVDGVLFDANQTTIISFPGAKLGQPYTIPATVTNVSDEAFYGCSGLFGVTIPHSVVSIGKGAFNACGNLRNLVIPDSVTSIGFQAFEGDSALKSIVLPGSVTNIDQRAFGDCANIRGAYFEGNAPTGDATVFSGDNISTIYYLPGTSGWGSSYGSRPTAVWQPAILTTDGFFGAQGGQFGFNLSWASNMTVTVQANSDLTTTNWSSLQSCVLTNGTFYFSESLQGNAVGRYYRLSYP